MISSNWVPLGHTRDMATKIPGTIQDNSVDVDELEAALAHMKQMQNDQPAAPPR